jgi:hypothetical protein
MIPPRAIAFAVCATACLLGLPASAATAAGGVPSPVAANALVRDPSTGDEWIFAVDSAGRLEGFQYTPTTNAWTMLPLYGGAAVAAGTQPVAVRNGTASGPNPLGFIAVYYVGSDGRIWNYNFTPATGWEAYPLPGDGATPAPGTSPTVIYTPTAIGTSPAGFTAVYYAGSDGHIWNYNWTPSTSWTAYALPGGGPPPAPHSSPVAVANLTNGGPNPSGFEAVYYIADTGQLWNYNYTPSTNWEAYALPDAAAPAAGTSPTVSYAPEGTGPNPPGFTAVYYAGSDGHIWNDNWTPSTSWTAYELPGSAPSPASATSPSVVENADQGGSNPDGFSAVYYLADTGQVWNDNWTPSTSWTSYQLGSAPAAASGTVTPVTLYDPAAGLSRVYVPDAAGNEDVWTYGASGWTLSRAFSLRAPTSTAAPVSTTLPLPTRATHGKRRRVRVLVALWWTWEGPVTVLRRVRIHRFPRAATLAVSCRGKGCPRIDRTATSRREPALVRSLPGRRFRAGDQLRITIAAPHKIPERIRVTIRPGTLPRATLVGTRQPVRTGR